MRQYHITLNGHTFDVKVLDDPRQEQVRVEVDGQTFTVGVEAVPALAAAEAAEAAPATLPSLAVPPPSPGPSRLGGGSIVAPLPGVIKSIAVQAGQRVACGDQLLVIEAMKMDNVIRAPCGGTVGKIHVTEGRQVAYGETLMEMSNDANDK